MNDLDLELAGRKFLNEPRTCQEYLERNPMVCCKGKFYNADGLVRDESLIRQQIYDLLQGRFRSGLSQKVEAVLSSLRLVARVDEIKRDEYDIPVANGTFNLACGFTPEKTVCRHRLPVRYAPTGEQPGKWLAFLDDLLEPKDIDTLQEFMGYCLLPTNRAQRMLMILGRGGEGKSRIGVVMKALFGENMNISSLAKVESSPYARADLEDLLVMVDDDMQMDALRSTHYIKSIITADLPMDVERKYVQSYQGRIHARFLAFGNGSLQALHDRSYGFFRRQIILTAKPRDPDRKDDPYLGERLAEEAEEILIWCINGLQRLIMHDYQFTTSQKAKENWESIVTEQNNVMRFMDSEGYIRRDWEGRITTRRLYELYRLWCEDNAIKPLSMRSFSTYLYAHQDIYGLTATNNIPIGGGKHVRGYLGIRADTGPIGPSGF